MASFKDFLNQLFKKEKTAYQAPFLHEAYDFDISSEAYMLWKGQKSHLALSQMIRQIEFQANLKAELPKGTDFLKSPKMAGFSLQCAQQEFKKSDYLYLSGWLIEHLKSGGYIKGLSEIKSRKKKGNIEQSIKAYLKPSRKMVKDLKHLQLYGNVSIELISINQDLHRYNVSCTYYQDQHFHDPLDFSEFIASNFPHE